MRKWQREVTSPKDIVEILHKCSTIRLSLNGMAGYPYCVPLSFGYEVNNNNLYIYFHCAKDGAKADLIKNDCSVCVEADILHGYVKTDNGVTADYESVIAYGKCWRVTGEDAHRGIELLLEHCDITGYDAAECAKREDVAVYRIRVESITGKKRF